MYLGLFRVGFRECWFGMFGVYLGLAEAFGGRFRVNVGFCQDLFLGWLRVYLGLAYGFFRFGLGMFRVYLYPPKQNPLQNLIR